MTFKYVDTDAGNDGDGGDVGDPWLTLQHALDQDRNLSGSGEAESHTVRVYGSTDQDFSNYEIKGWTMDSDGRLYVENFEAGWIGTWDDGVWHITNTDSVGIIVSEDYVNFREIMFEKISTSGNYQACLFYSGIGATNEQIVESCLFKGAGAGTRERMISSVDAEVILRVHNSVFFNGDNGSHSASSYINFTGTTLNIDNCVFDGGNIGVIIGLGTATTYNCLYSNPGGVPTTGSWDAASDYNSTTSATAVANNNTNDLESQTITYVNAAAGDFTPTGDGIDDGGSSPIYNFGAVDIIGTARPQNTVWDRGAFEIIGGEPPEGLDIPVAMMYYRRLRGNAA